MCVIAFISPPKKLAAKGRPSTVLHRPACPTCPLASCRPHSKMSAMAFDPTEEQKRLLAHDHGRHARVLAGPGTGKSSTVVAYLEGLLQRKPAPRVKLLTFTRSATGELAEKMATGACAERIRPSTIHSFAISVLLANGGLGSFPEPLRMADDWENENVVLPSLKRQMDCPKKGGGEILKGDGHRMGIAY